MAVAHVDPEKLRSFAQQLKQFGDFVDGSVDALDVALSRLGNSWLDQEYRAFQQQVRATQKRLRVFVLETKKTVPALNKDANVLDEYRRQQVGANWIVEQRVGSLRKLVNFPNGAFRK